MNIQKFANNFKPDFWSKYCQTELAKDLVVSNWCDHKFEGEIQYGKKLYIVTAGKPTVKTYTPGTDIAIEKITNTSQYLEIDKRDYFAFEVDDVDRAQSTPGYLETQFNEAKKVLADKQDAEVAKIAATGAGVGMTSSSIDLSTLTNVLEPLDDAMLELYKKNVSPKTELAADLLPKYIVKIRSAMQSLFTDNVDFIKNGAIGKYNNCYLRLSNNLHTDTTDAYQLVRTKLAVAVANQITNVEKTRKEKGFADIIKGLNTYGAKVVRPDELYVIKMQESTPLSI